MWHVLHSVIYFVFHLHYTYYKYLRINDQFSFSSVSSWYLFFFLQLLYTFNHLTLEIFSMHFWRRKNRTEIIKKYHKRASSFQSQFSSILREILFRKALQCIFLIKKKTFSFLSAKVFKYLFQDIQIIKYEYFLKWVPFRTWKGRKIMVIYSWSTLLSRNRKKKYLQIAFHFICMKQRRRKITSISVRICQMFDVKFQSYY